MKKIVKAWGHYYEFIIFNRIALRLIHYDYMASTSLHRHSTAELLIVLSGSISVERGRSVEQRYIHKIFPGRVVYIRAKEWHRMSGISNKMSYISNKKRGSIGFEIAKISDIERAIAAIPQP